MTGSASIKTCRNCGEDKNFSEFHKNKRQKYGLSNECKSCRTEAHRKDYKENWFKRTYILKKSYCANHGIEFNLTPEYLESIYTGRCPVFGLSFERHNKRSNNCPSIDRIDSSKGYVKGNVVYISARANRIKYNCGVDDLRKVLDWLGKTDAN